MSKALYKSFSIVAGALGGVLAVMLYKRLWRTVTHQDQVPDATSEDHGWGVVLTAAALQGAVHAGVKAAVDRGGAVGVRRLTGHWPE